MELLTDTGGDERRGSFMGSSAPNGMALAKPELLVLGAWREADLKLINFMRSSGYSVFFEADAARAPARPTLALVDLADVGEGDLAVSDLQRLGARSAILIADRAQAEVCIRSIEAWADDFLLRPVNQWELVARIRAVWRGWHTRPAPRARSNYTFAGYCLDTERYCLHRPHDCSVTLNRHGFILLKTFLDNSSRVLSRDELLTAMSGAVPNAHYRSIDIHIMRLRRQLGGEGRSLVRTVHGWGYEFIADVARR